MTEKEEYELIKKKKDRTEIFYGSQFSLIAVVCLKDNSQGQRKLVPNRLYRLFYGYEITADQIIVSPDNLAPINLYNDYLGDDYGNPKTTISVIVGENGSGKSTLLEYIIRLINNFSAATIGEIEYYPGAEHLHFIENLYGCFYFMHCNNMYSITVKGDKVTLDKYMTVKALDGGQYQFCDRKTIYHRDDRVLNGYRLYGHYAGAEDGLTVKNICETLFYTFVSNYSLYAYNTHDYVGEISDEDTEYNLRYEASDWEKYVNLMKSRGNEVGKAIPEKYKSLVTLDERSWLRGLFHKNDGYQTPIVLSPYRKEGNVDVNRENKLSRERLINLMLNVNARFRVVNGHLQIIGLRMRGALPEKTLKDVQEKIGWDELTEEDWEFYKKQIVKAWGGVLKENLKHGEYVERMYYKQAINYLQYKTCKIAATYSQYYGFYALLTSNDLSRSKKAQLIRKYIKSLTLDRSHITVKIRQTLFYLLNGFYDGQGIIDIEEASNVGYDWFEERAEAHFDDPTYAFVSSSDAVPPPFLKTEICLIDKNTRRMVSFDSLSSGEKQQAYSISSVLYHLSNINSVHDDENETRICYDSIFVVLEEIELYFHPELQKTYIRYLLDGIRQMMLNHIMAIHICLVTHSPFILSDVPHTCVLPLRKDDKEIDVQLPTFAANIYDMFKNSFFMTEGTIGSFAQTVIDKILLSLKIYQWAKEHEEEANNTYTHTTLPFSFPLRHFVVKGRMRGFYANFIFRRDKEGNIIFSFTQFSEKYTQDVLKGLIESIDEPFVRQMLTEEYLRTFPTDDNYRQREIAMLRERIEKLENME